MVEYLVQLHGLQHSFCRAAGEKSFVGGVVLDRLEEPAVKRIAQRLKGRPERRASWRRHFELVPSPLPQG